jgi:hypothetical protein
MASYVEHLESVSYVVWESEGYRSIRSNSLILKNTPLLHLMYVLAQNTKSFTTDVYLSPNTLD